MNSTNCASCLMPFSKDMGTRDSELYCSYCHADGNLMYEGTSLKEFQQMSFQGMRDSGMSWPMAKLYAWMIRFAPRWKK